MLIAEPNEHRYWKIMRAIGFALLLFLLFLNLFSLALRLLEYALAALGAQDPVSTVIHHLFYSAGYLASFMVPVAFLRLFVRCTGYEYQPMKTELRLSARLPLILLGGVAAIWTLAYLNAAMMSVFRYSAFSSEFIWGNDNGTEWYEHILNFIMICMVPAFCEEFLFRGAILTNCLPFGRGNAILISSLLFGLMHQNAEQIFYAFGAGLVLGLVYERTGSIWNCVFLHMVNNFLSTFEPVFLEGFSERTAGVAGAAFEVALLALGFIAVVILILRFVPRKPDYREGVFARPIPADDAYAECPVSAKTAVRRFFNGPMIAFLVLTAIEILALIGMAVFYA